MTLSIQNLQTQLKQLRLVETSEVIPKLLREAETSSWTYMAMDQYEANLLFHLINHLYEKTSNILTSNKDPEEWSRLLSDQGIAMAILDRLLHRSEVIQF
jgi:hypothetical protein